MMQKVSARVFLLTLAAAFAVPASAADREQRQMMADIRILQIQAQELQNQLGTLAEALKAINARLGDQTEATRRGLADQKLIINTLSDDLRVVREKVDDSNVRLGSLALEVDALRGLVTRLNVPPPASTAAPTDTPPVVDAPVDGVPPSTVAALPPPTGVAAVGASPQRLWNEALTDYYAAQWNLAVLGFESYVRTFPTSPQADDAQVYIGHAYFQDGKYEKALEAYDAAIRLYPTSDVLPDAYYRKGEALRALKRPDGAREAFEYVIKTYPHSDAAIQAKQRLQALQ